MRNGRSEAGTEVIHSVPGAAALSAAAAARAALGASAPWHEAVIDGVRLTYDDEGTGMPVVCLHAIGHGASDFSRLRAHLRERYRVIALDWPGQGRSGADDRPPSAARYAELLSGLLDVLALPRVVLIGNSIGGAAAIRYAAAHPERVDRLVLENPGGLDRADWLARLVTGGMARFFAAGARRARWFPFAFGAYYRLVLVRRPAAAQRARIVTAAYEIAPILEQAWREFGAPEADLRALVPQIRCPVLLAWAVRDQFVQLRRCAPAIRGFGDGRVERFRAGHAAHLETPEAFEAALDRFLAVP